MDGITIKDLPEEVLESILYNLPPTDIISICVSHKNIVCDSEVFWQDIATKNYPSVKPNKNQSWRHLVRQMITVDKLDIETQINYAIDRENFSMLMYLIKDDEESVTHAFEYAIIHNLDILRLLLEKYPDVTDDMISGYFFIIRYLIGFNYDLEHIVSVIELLNKYNSEISDDANWIGWIAHGIEEKTNIPLLTHMILHHLQPVQYNGYLTMAVRADNLEAVELLIKLGADDWDDGLIDSARVSNIGLTELFLSKHPNDSAKAEALSLAAKNGSAEIVTLILNSAPNLPAAAINEAFNEAINSNHHAVANILIKRGAENWDEALMAAARNNDVPGILQYVELACPNNSSECLNPVMETAAKYGSMEAVELLIRLGATNYETAFLEAIKYKQVEVVKYLLDKFKFSRQKLLQGLMLASSTKNDEMRALLKSMI